MELLSIIFPSILFSVLEATLIDELKRIIEQNAIAPSFPGIAWERCPRTAPQKQLQLVQNLTDLLEIDLNLEKYITNRQVCQGACDFMLTVSNTTTEGSKAVRKRRYIYDVGHDKAGIKKRVRRAQQIDAKLADFGEGLPQGTTFASKSCSSRRDNCVSNTFKTCPECFYILTMPTTYYPREHRAVLCTDGNDDSCLRGEGLCLSNRNVVTLRYDNQNLGIKRLGEWRETTVQIAKSCSCKIFRGSMFGDFVQK